MPYVYVHHRKSDNTIFYIGVSTIDSDYFTRSKSKKSRNKDWYKIVKEHGFTSEVVIKNVSLNAAYQAEREYIKFFGRLDLSTGILCNKSAGGDCVQTGTVAWNKGLKMPEEVAIKNKRKFYPKGKDHPNYGKTWSKEIKTKMAMSKIGFIPWNKGIKREDIKGEKHGRAKKLMDTATGIIYGTMKDAAKAFNISTSYLSFMMNGKYNNITTLKSIEA